MSVRKTVACLAAGLVCSALPTLTAAQTPPGTKPEPPAAVSTNKNVNPDAAILQDFKKRIDAYMAVHDKVAKEAPPLTQTDNPAKIKVAQTAFGEKLRQARASARPGDLLTPDIQQKFRELLRPKLTGEDGQDAKKMLKDDAPTNIPYKVNASYPEGKSLPTVPVSLLINLPTLPKALEYRIIDKNLIMRDVDGNIIVDFMLNAIP